jgi:adenylyl cyclase-associated protein
MANLDSAVSALVKRLESVTSRLEAVEKQIAAGASASAPSSGAAAGGSEGGESQSVRDYTDLISNYITPLVNVTNKIGSDELKKQVDLLNKGVAAQKAFLEIVAGSKKPSPDVLAKLVEPTSKLMGEIGAIRDQNRKSPQFNHLSAISEGISCLGWVMVEPTPGPFVNDARASSEFYSNKILVEFKKSNQDQVDWVHNWNTFLKDLFTFIKKNHTTGLVWNPRGGDAGSFKGGSAPAAAPSGGAGGPPPPPPAPTAPLTQPGEGTKADKPGPNPGNLFAEINKGGAITSGLKKVTKDMKNKYDPNKSSVISDAPAPAPEKKPAAKAATAVKKGAPKLELTGNKWLVEWQENNNAIEINETELKQTIYIYKCEKSVIRIKGKVNSVSLDSCKRVSVVFEHALALCEMVNCTSVEIQCTGRVPSVAIDKCSGVQFFVSKEGLDVEIVSSKSDQMNILIPDPAGGVDPVEIAVPEQFKTLIKNNKLVTTTVEHV